MQVAIVYLAVGFISLITYISSIVFVYTGEKDYERCAAGSSAILNVQNPLASGDLEAEINLSQADGRFKSRGATGDPSMKRILYPPKRI